MMTMMKASKLIDMTRLKTHRRKPPLGATTPLVGFVCTATLIVCTHWSCEPVMMAEPAPVSAEMALNVSTIAPTKRLSAMKAPKNIHAIEKSAAGEKSFRTGIWPGAEAAIAWNISVSQRSPEVCKKSVRLAWPKSSNALPGGLAHRYPWSSQWCLPLIVGSSWHIAKVPAKSCMPRMAKTLWMKK